MTRDYDPDEWRFRQYAEGHTDDSPVDLSGREGAPRCEYCHRPIDEDEGCIDPDCIAEREEELK
jgi:hypothetical protein